MRIILQRRMNAAYIISNIKDDILAVYKLLIVTIKEYL